MLTIESGDTVAVESLLYFIRHAQSVYVEGKERTRGLSEQGINDAYKIRDLLRAEDIDIFVSSPYERAIGTIRLLASEQGRKIHREEDLRERKMGDFTPATFLEAKCHLFEDFNKSFPNGESSKVAQRRAIAVIKSYMAKNQGKKIGIGTHGDIMTLMLNDYDKQYGYSFWKSTTMPDIYKVRLAGNEIIEVMRMWE